MPILLKLFLKISEERTIPNSFYKATITLIPKPDKNNTQKRKTLQARLQQYMNCELPDVQAGLEKAEIKLATSAGSSRKQESSRKTSISALWTMPKPLTVWITINCGKF